MRTRTKLLAAIAAAACLAGFARAEMIAVSLVPSSSATSTDWAFASRTIPLPASVLDDLGDMVEVRVVWHLAVAPAPTLVEVRLVTVDLTGGAVLDVLSEASFEQASGEFGSMILQSEWLPLPVLSSPFIMSEVRNTAGVQVNIYAVTMYLHGSPDYTSRLGSNDSGCGPVRPGLAAMLLVGGVLWIRRREDAACAA